MANQLAMQQEIDLTSELNLASNKNQILPFMGFNERKNPYLNGCLKSYMTKAKAGKVIDSKENIYTWENNIVKKNGEQIAVINNETVAVNQIEFPFKSDADIIGYLYLGKVRENKDTFVFCKKNGDTSATIYVSSGTTIEEVYTWEGPFSYRYNFTFTAKIWEYRLPYMTVICQINGTPVTANVGVQKKPVVIQINDLSYRDNLSLYIEDTYDGSDNIYFHKFGFVNKSVNTGNTSFSAIAWYGHMANPDGINNNVRVTSFFAVNTDRVNLSLSSILMGSSLNLNFAKILNYKSNNWVGIPSLSGRTFSLEHGSYTLQLNDARTALSINYTTATPFTYTADSFYDVSLISKLDRYNANTEMKIQYFNDCLVAAFPISVKNNGSGSAAVDEKTEDTCYLVFDGFDSNFVATGGGIKFNRYISDKKIKLNRNTARIRSSTTFNGAPSETDFYLCFNSSFLAGISYKHTLIASWLSVNTDNFYPYALSEDSICYQDNDGVIYSATVTATDKIYLLDNKYIMFDSCDLYNVIDISSDLLKLWKNGLDYVGPYNAGDDYLNIGKHRFSGSGLGVNYTVERNPFPSAIWGPTEVHNGLGEAVTDASLDCDNYIGETIPMYTGSTSGFKNELKGMNYPVATDGNFIFNVPLNATITKTSFNTFYFTLPGRTVNNGITFNGSFKGLYPDGGEIGKVSAIFNLQGQIYFIQNETLSTGLFSDNKFTNIQDLLVVDDLVFVGANLTAAYFYSSANKTIYQFTGNRQMERIFEIDISKINASAYLINCDLFVLLGDTKVILFNSDGYSWTITGTYNEVKSLEKGFALINEEGIKIINLYGENNVPVEFTTAFYGAMENRLSVIDCWYIRLYSEEAIAGDVTCSLITMTDTAAETAQQTFHIAKEQWNPLSKTVLIRYQPKYQRSIGTSLKVTSDFDVQDLQCSYSTDTALQISRPVGTTMAGGKI